MIYTYPDSPLVNADKIVDQPRQLMPIEALWMAVSLGATPRICVATPCSLKILQNIPYVFARLKLALS
jgi:hypothetical protein